VATNPAPKKVSKERSRQITPPSISFPKGGGAIRGISDKVSANPVTGASSMTVPTTCLCQRVLIFHHFPEEEGVGNDCLASLGQKMDGQAQVIIIWKPEKVSHNFFLKNRHS